MRERAPGIDLTQCPDPVGAGTQLIVDDNEPAIVRLYARDVEPGDDYAAIEQAVRRRW